MSRFLPFAALLGVLALVTPRDAGAVGPPTAPESDTQKIVYLGDRGPVLIGLNVRIDGRSFRAVNRELMNKLFDQLDRDGDGTLSKEEAAAAPSAASLSSPFAFFGGRGPMARMPVNKDGQVTREALAAFYRQAGLTAFQVTYTPRDSGVRLFRADGRRGGQGGNAEQITTRLYDLLDADKDGKLSRKELAAAPGLLKKLDINEDEMLTTDELMGDTTPAGDGQFAVAFSSDGPVLARGGQPLLHVVGDGPSDEALAKALVAKYGKAGDKAVSGARLGLSKGALADLDSDKDGKLSLAELARFGQRRPDVGFIVRLGKRSGNESMVESAGKLPAGVGVEKAGAGVTLVLGNSRLELGGPVSDGGPQFAGFNIADQYKTRFQAADTDGNGYLDKQEAAKSPFFRDTFAAMDRDGDGQLFEKEMLAYVKKMEALRTLAGKSCISVVVTNKGKGVFELFDADGDGRLSVRELRNVPKVLDRLDADKDGALAKGEVPTHHRGAFELGPSDGQSNFARAVFIGGGMPQPATPTRTTGPLWLRKMDRNRDGDVSRAEFLGTDAQFKAIDADGDELISVAEAERYDRRGKKSKE